MKIAMFGATGMLGLPVAQRLIQDGNELTALVRRGKEKEVPKGCRVIIGDLKNEDDIRKTVSSCEGIYLNLSVTQSSREKDFQPEREGIQDILKICEQENIKVIGYLSSLVQNYQGLNGFDWWVFRVKNQAVNMIQKHSIPSIIFRPSTFMENFDKGSYRQGQNIALAGNSAHPMYFIAGEDYARMATKAFKQFDGKNAEYIIQGTQAFTADEAAKIFVENYKKEKIKVMKLPFWMLQLFGKLSPKFNYGANIVEALNNYSEKFDGTKVWDKLGKPELTLKEYARRK
jgi:nucleoside-diphosphate-sugar epimerase